MLNFSDLIVEYKDVLDADICQDIIKRFEESALKGDGQAGDRSPTKKKVSTDLFISELSEWEDVDSYIYQKFSPFARGYLNFLNDNFHGEVRAAGSRIMDSGYQIQRTNSGEYYRWHTDDQYSAVYDTITMPTYGDVDSASCGYQRRLFTYIFYLNDGFSGGRTQFIVGPEENDIISITPETGKLVCFPANFLYPHQGEEVIEGSKYLMTGWVSDYITSILSDTSPVSYEWRKDYRDQGKILLLKDSSETGTEGAEMPLDASIIGS